MSLPSYEEFRLALADPARRSQIGLVIADSDAQSLAGNEEWARNYYDSWIALAEPAAAAAPAAPTDPLASSAPAVSPPPAAPTEQIGYSSTGGNPPQGAAPKKKGLPGWAIGVIIAAAALVVIGGIATALFVVNAIIDATDSSSASSNSQSDDAPSPTATPEEIVPEEGTDDLPDGLGGDYEPSYSEADAAAFTAAVAPVFGLEESEYVDAEMIRGIVIGAGESICEAIAAGYSEEELSEPMVSADLTAADVQILMDASRQYLCP